MEKYRDVSCTPRERAEDLLSKMTLREKVGQLNQKLYGFAIYNRINNDFELTDEFKEEVEKWGGLGTLYGLYRADPWSARTDETGITCELSQKAYNMVQKYVIEHSRFGIPMLMSTECPHGHQALGGGLLPVNTAVGATFDEELLRKAYAACGKQLADGHVDLALMSVLDVLRDPRWGRSEECYSEDPVLSAKMAKAAIEGMQSSDVDAVAKHLCAQGECTGGVNASAARIGERELREIHLQAIKACCDSKVKGVMAAYNEIDGIYCHANPHLLRDILRDEMGFEGVVMADGCAIDCLDRVTADNAKSGALALKSGVDISLWDKGFTQLEKAVEEGLVSEALIDEAALRVLTLKFERGLFETPYMSDSMKEEEYYGIDKLSLQLARESVVLLKNNDVLPLEKQKRIAVFGVNAVSRYALMGDYTPPRSSEKCVTVLEGLQALGKESGIIFEYIDHEDFSADDYDLAIVVGGGSSSRFLGTEFDINGAALNNNALKDENPEKCCHKLKMSVEKMECGEGMDVADLRMNGEIEKFMRERLAGKLPVVFVCVAGRPYALAEADALSDAVLYSFYPGPFGGKAIAEILLGITNPSGRLPVSIPGTVGQLPVYYNYKDSYAGMKYCDKNVNALYTFGEGLSYGNVRYENVSIDGMKISFEIFNDSETEDVAIPQVYIHRIGGFVTARVRELKTFKRIPLKAKERMHCELQLCREDFGFYNESMKFVTDLEKADVILADRGKDILKETILL